MILRCCNRYRTSTYCRPVSHTRHRKVKVVHYSHRQHQLLKHPLGVRKGLTNSFSVLQKHKEGCGFRSGPQPPSLPLLPLLPSSPLPLCPSLPVHVSLATHALVAATAAAEGGKYSGSSPEHNEALQWQSYCSVTATSPDCSVLQPGTVAVLLASPQLYGALEGRQQRHFTPLLQTWKS